MSLVPGHEGKFAGNRGLPIALSPPENGPASENYIPPMASKWTAAECNLGGWIHIFKLLGQKYAKDVNND